MQVGRSRPGCAPHVKASGNRGSDAFFRCIGRHTILRTECGLATRRPNGRHEVTRRDQKARASCRSGNIEAFAQLANSSSCMSCGLSCRGGVCRQLSHCFSNRVLVFRQLVDILRHLDALDRAHAAKGLAAVLRSGGRAAPNGNRP